MAAINFPSSPNLNDIFQSGSLSWQWDGSRWRRILSSDVVTTTAAQTISQKTYVSPREVRHDVSGSNIDLSLASYYTKTISGTTTLTLTNAPSNGISASFILELTNGGSSIVNWWSGLRWSNGVAPTLVASGRDVLSFYTTDGGVTWVGLHIGRDVK